MPMAAGGMPASTPPFEAAGAGGSRRRFLGRLVAGGAIVASGQRSPAASGPVGSGSAAPPAADDDSFWDRVQQAWEHDPAVINLEHGGVQAAPRPVTEAFLAAWRRAQLNPALTLQREQWPAVERVRQELAAAFGCPSEELALTRNTTEAMETVLLGHPLQPGERVLTTTRDYWRFHDTLRQRAAREGIELDVIRLPDAAEGDDAVVAAFVGAVTPRTRLALLSHVVNLTGRFLPVARIASALRRQGVAVAVDGAHGFAHVPLNAPDLGCDYYGTSLHKWLGAPHGTGFLHVRRERIGPLWPHFPARVELRENIRKFESLGTLAAAPFLAIPAALAFWREIGPTAKAARLRWLRERWLGEARGIPGVRVVDDVHPTEGGALATVAIAGLSPSEVARWLRERHRVVVRAVEHPEFAGVRVTPSLATRTDEVAFLPRLLAAAARGRLD